LDEWDVFNVKEEDSLNWNKCQSRNKNLNRFSFPMRINDRWIHINNNNKTFLIENFKHKNINAEICYNLDMDLFIIYFLHYNYNTSNLIIISYCKTKLNYDSINIYCFRFEKYYIFPAWSLYKWYEILLKICVIYI